MKSNYRYTASDSHMYLPHDHMTSRYTAIRTNISTKYVEIEEQLVDEFIEAHRSLDMKRMKQYAGALQPFFGVSVIELHLRYEISSAVPAGLSKGRGKLYSWQRSGEWVWPPEGGLGERFSLLCRLGCTPPLTTCSMMWRGCTRRYVCRQWSY